MNPYEIAGYILAGVVLAVAILARVAFRVAKDDEDAPDNHGEIVKRVNARQVAARRRSAELDANREDAA